MKVKRISMTACFIAFVCMAWAGSELTVSEHPIAGLPDLTSAQVVYDQGEASVVKKAAELLVHDIALVSGKTVALSPDTKTRRHTPHVIIGTIGQSRLIEALVAKGKIDVSEIRGGWERYLIKTVDNNLIIAGSDRRGTAYGVFSVSEAIGVSPWYWWADVPVEKHDRLFVQADVVSREPSVKYRGIFINDEDWGLKPWASKNFEKELGDIGPRTYAKVCELLLRLKGNMLAPAMHECSGAFYSHAESKMVADSFAIVITTSHCEPLLLNNASKHDWDSQRDGDWDYGRNPEGIRKRWNSRLDEASQYENIYTTAMRGLHDAGLRGGYTMEERVPLLEGVIRDQREMLTAHIGKQATEIPQIFVPYKETMDVYENGLRVPEDITLVWVDDNYGYMKRVSSPDEQRRSGHSGVYYHSSYLGAPHDYLWLNTTPPVLMYNELKKAYDTGADRYWLLNVGDIKPCELGITTYFAMAWNLEAFSYEHIHLHQAGYVAKLFNLPPAQMQTFLDDYYRLAWSRKPEFMGWEREWDEKELEMLHDTEFSFANYNDAQQRLADYQLLSDQALSIMNALPMDYRPAFYEMVAFPAMDACQMNRKFMMAQLNHELFAQGDMAGANWAARESRQAYDSIQSLMDGYNKQLDGKWDGMMSHAPTWRAKHHLMPDVSLTEGIDPFKPSVANVDEKKFALEGCTVIDLANIFDKVENGYTMRLIKGIGYDWQCLQLGEQTQPTVELGSKDTPKVEYLFQTDSFLAETGQTDSVEVTIFTLPIWPLHRGRSTRFGVAVDGSEMQIFANEPQEYSPKWKTNVLRNGVQYKARFATDSAREQHLLTLSCIDPGTIVQRIIIDWGGLKTTYVGVDGRSPREK